MVVARHCFFDSFPRLDYRYFGERWASSWAVIGEQPVKLNMTVSPPLNKRVQQDVYEEPRAEKENRDILQSEHGDPESYQPHKIKEKFIEEKVVVDYLIPAEKGIGENIAKNQVGSQIGPQGMHHEKAKPKQSQRLEETKHIKPIFSEAEQLTRSSDHPDLSLLPKKPENDEVKTVNIPSATPERMRMTNDALFRQQDIREELLARQADSSVRLQTVVDNQNKNRVPADQSAFIKSLAAELDRQNFPNREKAIKREPLKRRSKTLLRDMLLQDEGDGEVTGVLPMTVGSSSMVPRALQEKVRKYLAYSQG